MSDQPLNSGGRQLALPLRLLADASFDNFRGSENRKAVVILKQMLEQRVELFGYLYGPAGTGKSHLLCAACRFMEAHRVIYLPLMDIREELGVCFEGLEQFDLVCLDDIQVVAGNPEREAALFGLYNRLREQGRQLLVAAPEPPLALGVVMPDLASRLAWGLVVPVKALEDEEKSLALRLRAAETGVELSEDVVSFIMKRSSRSLAELFDLFDRLDEAAFKARRRITVPFVKEVLGW